MHGTPSGVISDDDVVPKPAVVVVVVSVVEMFVVSSVVVELIGVLIMVVLGVVGSGPVGGDCTWMALTNGSPSIASVAGSYCRTNDTTTSATSAASVTLCDTALATPPAKPTTSRLGKTGSPLMRTENCRTMPSLSCFGVKNVSAKYSVTRCAAPNITGMV